MTAPPPPGAPGVPALVLAALLTLVAAGNALAEPPRLIFPAACTPGTECWIIQYPDQDPGPGHRDHACQARSYDGHGGTDIGVADLAAVERGVDVLAAATGRVAATRDDMDDRGLIGRSRAELKGRDCGNAVRIDHGDGWQTLYCHLRQGSVAVREGQRVAAGDRLGAIGMSGAAEFPHVELTLMHRGTDIDPFTGTPVGSAPDCTAGTTGTAGTTPRPGHLWRADALAAVAYRPFDVVTAGFATAVADSAAIHAGTAGHDRLPADAPGLVLWAEAYGLRQGDRVTFTITAPDGTTLARNTETMAADKIRITRSYGKRRTGGPWRSGTWTGTVTLERPASGATTSATRTVTVEP